MNYPYDARPPTCVYASVRMCRTCRTPHKSSDRFWTPVPLVNVVDYIIHMSHVSGINLEDACAPFAWMWHLIRRRAGTCHVDVAPVTKTRTHLSRGCRCPCMGWDLIWLMAGLTTHSLSNLSNCFVLKLETPMDLTTPR